MDYKIIRSRRKTVGFEIKDGKLIVRAPAGMTDGEIDRFVIRHMSWIEKNIRKSEIAREKREITPKLKDEELDALRRRAEEYIPERVAYYAPIVGVTYGKITVRCQKTRWGSCSSKGNLSFNCLLMLLPPEVIDSVVVHELCHRREMNHSKNFYSWVYKVFPQYDKWHRVLNLNGRDIMNRVK